MTTHKVRGRIETHRPPRVQPADGADAALRADPRGHAADPATGFRIKSHRARRPASRIASDGEATDGDIAAALRHYGTCRPGLLRRLCTDDDRVAYKYWNEIDEDLELDMDVLDDLEGEAAEVNEAQPWLTYGAPLHRLREWGTLSTSCSICWTNDLGAQHELPGFASLILGEAACDGLPHPSLDWKGFLTAPTRTDVRRLPFRPAGSARGRGSRCRC